MVEVKRIGWIGQGGGVFKMRRLVRRNVREPNLIAANREMIVVPISP